MTFLAPARSSIFLGPLAAASIVVACSSGSTTSTGDDGGTSTPLAQAGGQAKLKTCKNSQLSHPTTAADDVCNACTATKCASESGAALGTDPNAFGGACAQLVQCECDCASGDTACLNVCLPQNTTACKAALEAAIGCDHTTCGAECGVFADAGGG